MRSDDHHNGHPMGWFLLALIIAAAGGLTLALLLEGLSLVTLLSQQYSLWLVPAVGFGLAGMIYFWDRAAMGYGMDHYIVAATQSADHIAVKTVVTKGLATALTIGTGGSGGLAGPIAVIGGALANGLERLPLVPALTPTQRRLLVICGAASMLGALFGAPIGGGLIACEVLYRSSLHYMDMFPAVFSSAVGAAAVSLVANPGPDLLLPAYYTHAIHLPFFLLVGLAAGSVMLGFDVIFRLVQAWLGRIRLTLVRMLLAGLGVGLILFALPEAGGLGLVVLAQLMTGGQTIGFLLLLLLGKMLTTALTVGCGGSGGLVMPALFLGAVAGQILASLIQAAPELVGAATAAGMAAALAAGLNVPIGAAVIIAEMAGWQMGVPAVLGSIGGYAVGHQLLLYDQELGIAEAPAQGQ